MNKKGFASIILIALVVVLVGAGGYFILRKDETPQVPFSEPTTPAPVNQIADWETYRNEKYGFEVKYPPNWVVVEDYQNSTPLINIIKQKDDNVGEAFAPFSYPTYRGSTRTATYISNFSIYPTGYPSEPPNWELVLRNITLDESVKATSDFTLDDGTPFITGISFTNPPVTWDEYGFISIGLPVSFLKQKCMLDGNELYDEHC